MKQPFNPTAGVPKTSFGSSTAPSFDNATWFSTVQPISSDDDPPLVLWDKITQRNCVVLDYFSSQELEETTYYQLQQGKSLQPFWRRDDEIEEQATFHGYDAGELCWRYEDKFGKPYTGTTASIKAIYEALILRKADVSHSRSRDGGREIIGDLSDIIVQAMHWREEAGLGYE